MNQGRGPTRGAGTSKCGTSQLRWSLQFKEVKIVNLSHKKDDPGMPSIQCSINGYNLQKTLCDTGSGVNIMAAVTYQTLVRNHAPKTDIHSAPDDFKVIDMGEDEYNTPITIGRPFLSTVKAIIYIGTREIHMHFTSKKVRCYFTNPNYIVEDPKQVSTRRRRRNRNQRRKITKDLWVDYVGEVHRVRCGERR